MADTKNTNQSKSGKPVIKSNATLPDLAYRIPRPYNAEGWQLKRHVITVFKPMVVTQDVLLTPDKLAKLIDKVDGECSAVMRYADVNTASGRQAIAEVRRKVVRVRTLLVDLFKDVRAQLAVHPTNVGRLQRYTETRFNDLCQQLDNPLQVWQAAQAAASAANIAQVMSFQRTAEQQATAAAALGASGLGLPPSAPAPLQFEPLTQQDTEALYALVPFVGGNFQTARELLQKIKQGKIPHVVFTGNQSEAHHGTTVSKSNDQSV